jgi:hypothetical protein
MPTKEEIAEFLSKNANDVAEYAEKALRDYEELYHIASSPDLTDEEVSANDISGQELHDYYDEIEEAQELLTDERLHRIFFFVNMMRRAK